MGKGTDKLYITHSEWSSADAYSANSGTGVARSKVADSTFKRLPFNYCSLSLQPFNIPVCTAGGTIFDYERILSWLAKHGTNPVNGQALKAADLIKLNFAQNDHGEYVDPVTYKAFTDNTHIVAILTTGNVFAWDTVDRLNVKAKNWRDLVNDSEFGRKDIITLQDPQNVASRDLSSFMHIRSTREGQDQAQKVDGNNRHGDRSEGALKVLKAKEAVAQARADRQKAKGPNGRGGTTSEPTLNVSRAGGELKKATLSERQPIHNAAHHTTGKAAASFTSTGLTPHTSGERAVLTEEEYMLKPRRVKIKGYARLQTTVGSINIELQTEYAPKAVWNFVQLSKKGYYRNIAFHRNIRNFMIQGGDPTGTGRGGASIWNRPFADEFDGPLTHDSRGVVSMANKGKNTNTSQFFITYRPAKHLDRKHTIFGRVVDGMETLRMLEEAQTDEKDRPVGKLEIEDIVVFLDPFEEFQQQRSQEAHQKEEEELQKIVAQEADLTTWTGKRVVGKGTVQGGSGGVGRYLKTAVADLETDKSTIGTVDDFDEILESKRKKVKTKGFGDFETW